MAINLFLYASYMILLGICIVVGTLIWRRSLGATRIFYVLIVVIACSEIAALVSEILTGSNDQVYNVTDIIQAVILFWYFGTAIRKDWLRLILCMFTIGFGIYNYYWLQFEDIINNYFLLWNGIAAVCLCLYIMLKLYQRDGAAGLPKFASFWIAAVVLFYWVVNLMSLQVFNALLLENLEYAVLINVVHLSSNIICYAAIALIFYKTPILIQ